VLLAGCRRKGLRRVGLQSSPAERLVRLGHEFLLVFRHNCFASRVDVEERRQVEESSVFHMGLPCLRWHSLVVDATVACLESEGMLRQVGDTLIEVCTGVGRGNDSSMSFRGRARLFVAVDRRSVRVNVQRVNGSTVKGIPRGWR
jgi:hypothetical protein